MRGGVILIVVALLVGYLGISGKYKCFTKAFDCIVNGEDDCDCNKTASLNSTSSGFKTFPTIAPLTPIRPLRSL